MKQAAKVINMKGHRVGRGGKLVELFAPADIEAHRGTDNRYYVLDTARVFPPEPVRENTKRENERAKDDF